ARTFLGASRGANRKPNPFTGFDPLDNVPMHALQPGLLREIDIVDLKGVVTQLRDALVKQASSPQVAALAHMLCSPRHDRYGLLQARLRSFEDADPVLGSLQRELVEHLNRVLESERLDRCEAFRVFLDRDAAASVRNYIEHGNLVFANRKLLELAFPDALPKFDFPPPPPHKLMHVINLTLNLVHGRQLAWQERKAAPFAVTPMYAGNYYLGYRESRNYGDGVSIATAAAISGAAVSPNMGYSSSPLTTLLLTLFNVRLGWWLGNPGSAGALTYRRREPRLSVRPVLSEALGMTDDQSPYVYLSDGGHFENLGLFEMVLRRCHLMVVFDAGADPGYRFDDLGNAVRKVRIDLGIPIEFETLPMRKRGGGDDGSIRYCTLGRVRYAAVDGADAPDGLLLYFKPVLCGGEPADVLHYASENTDFPQEPTTDQFFGEAQFESYRRLGQFAVDTALNGVYCEGRTWAADLVQGVRRYLKESAASPWIDAWLALSSQGKP
ncbi:MAG TPA: hypothetical protein VFB54_16605, partial [Burkholderiales bacterium]|nr:hypothetical protein [Burkholderiales bacterium]